MQYIHIIEDNILLLETFLECLKQIDYQALGFASAEDYIHHMNAPAFIAPALIISDVNMPGLCGINLAHKVRQKGITAPYILMTGNPSQLYDVNLTELNIAAIWTKPVFFPKLKNLLIQHIDKQCTSPPPFYQKGIYNAIAPKSN